MDLPDLPDMGRPDRFYRDDAVRWIWILYGLTQAAVTMLIAFDVLEGTTVPAVVTAVALVAYVGVNEILVRPHYSRIVAERRRPAASSEPADAATRHDADAATLYDEDAAPPDQVP